MFTGIVVETGTVERIKPTAKSIEVTIRGRQAMRGLKVGDSLAINGCCLTVVKLATRGKDRLAQFDLLQESWMRTNLQFAKPGSLVNLEPSLRASGALNRTSQIRFVPWRNDMALSKRRREVILVGSRAD